MILGNEVGPMQLPKTQFNLLTWSLLRLESLVGYKTTELVCHIVVINAAVLSVQVLEEYILLTSPHSVQQLLRDS